MEKRLLVVSGTEEVRRCFEIMRELRPHLSLEEYLDIYHESHRADGYEIAVIEHDGKIVAAMGYRFLTDFVRGRHVYIDDLVTTAAVRSQGLGTELLKFAEGVAQKNGCRSLRLCTGLDNTGGVRFYEREGWARRSYAYVKKTG